VIPQEPENFIDQESTKLKPEAHEFPRELSSTLILIDPVFLLRRYPCHIN